MTHLVDMIDEMRHLADTHEDIPPTLPLPTCRRVGRMMDVLFQAAETLEGLHEEIKRQEEAVVKVAGTLLTHDCTIANLRQRCDRYREALAYWLKAYDDTGPDNGPSLCEHEAAEKARQALGDGE